MPISFSKKSLIRTIYLYLFALLGLVLIIIGTVTFINLGLKTYIFKKADTVAVFPKRIPMEEMMGKKEISEEELKKQEEEERKFQEEQRTSNRQRDAARALSFVIVGLPVYLYHWRIIKSDAQV